jgi:DNA-binding beta-propeller fold protein YncE
VVGVGTGYGLVQRGTQSPILRTVSIGRMPGNYNLDVADSRLDIQNMGDGTFSTIDTRTGRLAPQPGSLRTDTGGTVIDAQVGHLFKVGPTVGRLLMQDVHTGALLRTIPVPWTATNTLLEVLVDERAGRAYLDYRQAAQVIVLDTHTGRVIATKPACPASAYPVLSRRAGHLFVPCGDGSTDLIDVHIVRAPTTVQTNLGTAVAGLADEATGRVFLAGTNQLVVLNAATGRVLQALAVFEWTPIPTYPGGIFAQDTRTGDVLVVATAQLAISPPSFSEVLVLDGRSGRIRHRWAVPKNPTSVLVNPLTGHVLVTSVGPTDAQAEPMGSGTLSVLDGRTGKMLRRIVVGLLPAALQADTHTGHLFLINHNTTRAGLPLSRRRPEGTLSHLLRTVKARVQWLPFTPPSPPPPPSTATVMMLDLTTL